MVRNLDFSLKYDTSYLLIWMRSVDESGAYNLINVNFANNQKPTLENFQSKCLKDFVSFYIWD